MPFTELDWEELLEGLALDDDSDLCDEVQGEPRVDETED